LVYIRGHIIIPSLDEQELGRAAPGSDEANTEGKLRRHLHLVTFSNILPTLSDRDF